MGEKFTFTPEKPRLQSLSPEKWKKYFTDINICSATTAKKIFSPFHAVIDGFQGNSPAEILTMERKELQKLFAKQQLKSGRGKSLDQIVADTGGGNCIQSSAFLMKDLHNKFSQEIQQGVFYPYYVSQTIDGNNFNNKEEVHPHFAGFKDSFKNIAHIAVAVDVLVDGKKQTYLYDPLFNIASGVLVSAGSSVHENGRNIYIHSIHKKYPDVLAEVYVTLPDEMVGEMPKRYSFRELTENEIQRFDTQHRMLNRYAPLWDNNNQCKIVMKPGAVWGIKHTSKIGNKPPVYTPYEADDDIYEFAFFKTYNTWVTFKFTTSQIISAYLPNNSLDEDWQRFKIQYKDLFQKKLLPSMPGIFTDITKHAALRYRTTPQMIRQRQEDKLFWKYPQGFTRDIDQKK